jgi:hypothetical protein
MRLSKAPRVRLHYFDQATPSVEGLLLSRRHREYAVGIPELLTDESQEGRVRLAANTLLVPREAVSMLEVLS